MAFINPKLNQQPMTHQNLDIICYLKTYCGWSEGVRSMMRKYGFAFEEKDIIKAQPDMEGKPEAIVEKMMGGRIKKFLKENSLVDQPFVKNPEVTIGQLAKDGGAEVISFTRFEVGEGIVVEEVDFATEVAAQLSS